MWRYRWTNGEPKGTNGGPKERTDSTQRRPPFRLYHEDRAADVSVSYKNRESDCMGRASEEPGERAFKQASLTDRRPFET